MCTFEMEAKEFCFKSSFKCWLLWQLSTRNNLKNCITVSGLHFVYSIYLLHHGSAFSIRGLLFPLKPSNFL